jgi:SCP-2 sterol transfer family
MEYLSDAWIDALDAAVRDAPPLRTTTPLVIESVVTEVPRRGEVRYRLAVDASGARARSGDAGDPPPELRLTTDYATAVAIAQGTENAQTALARGRLRLGGDVNVLIAHADTLSTLDDLTAGVRAETTYELARESKS